MIGGEDVVVVERKRLMGGGDDIKNGSKMNKIW